ncbi:hypothetical protein L7F22_055426 [Adiantum nelumboides]|nr:hypothetical protein [Adiantum nelumboides]
MGRPTFPKLKVITNITIPPLSLPIDILLDAPPRPKKRNQLNWTKQDMAKALQARENNMSLHKCSLQFGMSRTAISNWGRRHTLFSNGIPGKSWWDNFCKRHPKLVFRVSEGLDQSRATRFRPEIVESLHDKLQKLYDEHKYPPSYVWNADETGFQGSRDKGMKILAKKGAKVVYGVTWDSKEWMTVLCCVNAEGQSIPSYYIIKGSRIASNYIANCEGAAMAMKKKARMTSELFQAWLEHFDNAITQMIGKTSKHLLILDGHGSHVSLEVVAKAYEAEIDIITLPAHTSHKLQHLDVFNFCHLKYNFEKNATNGSKRQIPDRQANQS